MIPNSPLADPQCQDQTPPSGNPDMTQPQHQGEEPLRQNPLSPDKTLTVETEDPQQPQQADPVDPQDQPQFSLEEVQHEENAEMVSPASPIADYHITITTITASRRGGASKGKKGNQKRRAAQEKKFKEKLKVLAETLKPIPFVPIKTLDFSRHEKLLKRLGLWDFVHLEFDQSLRDDLIAQLIATFSPTYRCSYVNGARIMVNRADLARALKLPVKKDRVSDSTQEVLESKESIAFLDEFVSIWVLLHGDAWIMPNEVLNWTKAIKEGHIEKLDWAGLFWFMVEKELMAAPQLENCYYASHLQCLIKYQKEEFLRDVPTVEGDVKVEEVEMEEEEEEEEDGSGDVKMVGGVDDFQGGMGLEEHVIELSLGQENVAEGNDEKEQVGHEDVMDFEENKVDESEQWLLDGKRNVEEPFLQRCSIDNVGGMECDDKKKKEEEEECEEEGHEEGEDEGEEEEEDDDDEDEDEEELQQQHEREFSLSPNAETLEGITSENLIAAMEAAQIPFSSGVQIPDNSSGEFLVSGAHIHAVPGGSSPFRIGNKREICHENDISHQPLIASSKRLRINGPCNDKSSDFDTCMDQIQHLMGKARMMYALKEQACGDSSVNHQILLHELQQRDSLIEHLHKAKFEEQNKRRMEVSRLEHELLMMEKLLEGYRKALKETQKAFAEYRARCPQADEPLYKDVKGSGGLVLSTMELEKLQAKQVEEERIKRILIEKMFKDIEVEWELKCEAHNNGVCLLGNRLLDVEKEVKLLKELFAKRKIPNMLECAAPTKE